MKTVLILATFAFAKAGNPLNVQEHVIDTYSSLEKCQAQIGEKLPGKPFPASRNRNFRASQPGVFLPGQYEPKDGGTPLGYNRYSTAYCVEIRK